MGADNKSATPSEHVPGASLRQKCATGVLRTDGPFLDLARVVEAWPGLPEPIRAAIMAIIHATK